MKHKQRTIVSAVLRSSDDQILLGKVRAGGVYPDCWHIPGGGVEDGEEKTAALNREIREEVGLDIQKMPMKLLCDTDTGEAVKVDKDTGEKVLMKMQFNVYEVQLGKPSAAIVISLNDDLKEYQWVPLSELRHYKHTPPSQKLFEHLGWV